MSAFKIVGTYGTMYYVNSMEAAIAWHSKALGGLKPSFESPDWTEFPLPGGHSLCLDVLDESKNRISFYENTSEA